MILEIHDKKAETKNCFSLILEKPANFSFYPGQYLDIELPVNDPNGNTRAFTISSSPTEDFLMISPKKGISPFKKFMEKLQAGQAISTSHPAGTFTLDDKEPAVFIAGGIGITPFRSIIKYALDQKLKTPITLIYSNSDENFLFKKKLESWQRKLPSLKIIYHNTSKLEGFYLDSRLLTLDSIFYLAGPPKMVDDFEKMFLNFGIDETSIRTDRFDGY